MTTADSSSQHSDSDQSDTREAAAVDPASDVDAPGEEYDEDDEVAAAASDSSEDVDAEGEPDGDYDSESPPSEQAESDRARSSSQESTRPRKRKASDEKEDYIEQNPELYGLRRSVRGISTLQGHELTAAQGRARPSRRIVSDPQLMGESSINSLQVDSDDEDDEDYSSDQPRKRQRTASRKSLSPLALPISSPTNPSV
jgi:chromodomain-helicase-DNA-binding protein 1